GDRHNLQGRGAVLADGEPLEDHGRRQVRLRLRRRSGAQGFCTRVRRSAAEWRRAPSDGRCRSILRRGAGDRWQSLGLLELNSAARTEALTRSIAGTISSRARAIAEAGDALRQVTQRKTSADAVIRRFMLR